MFTKPEGNFVYRMNRLDGTDKKGILTPDENGYYTICIGALDHASKNRDARGNHEYYSSVGADAFFKEGTLFNQRIKGGFIRAEYGHPKRTPGMTDKDFLERNMQIHENMQCGTFGAIWLVPNYTDPLTGEKCTAIYGKIKPNGPYGDALKRDLEDPGMNVCFSIRSLTTYQQINGRMCKVLHTVITFDYVIEPGITAAEKLSSMSLENYAPNLEGVVDGDVVVSQQTAQRLIDSKSSLISNESYLSPIIQNIANNKETTPFGDMRVKRTLSKVFGA